MEERNHEKDERKREGKAARDSRRRSMIETLWELRWGERKREDKVSRTKRSSQKHASTQSACLPHRQAPIKSYGPKVQLCTSEFTTATFESGKVTESVSIASCRTRCRGRARDPHGSRPSTRSQQDPAAWQPGGKDVAIAD
jgi:hypothetical protein